MSEEFPTLSERIAVVETYGKIAREERKRIEEKVDESIKEVNVNLSKLHNCVQVSTQGINNNIADIKNLVRTNSITLDNHVNDSGHAKNREKFTWSAIATAVTTIVGAIAYLISQFTGVSP